MRFFFIPAAPCRSTFPPPFTFPFSLRLSALAVNSLSLTLFLCGLLPSAGNSIVDYSLLFSNTLLDYLEASGDQETGHDLYTIAERQFHLALRRVGEDFIYVVPVAKDLLGGGEWHFIDCEFVQPTRARLRERRPWFDLCQYRANADMARVGNEELDKSTAFQCIVIFCIKALVKLASTLGKPEPSFAAPGGGPSLSATEYSSKLSEAIYAKAFVEGVYVSGPKKQLSWASNAFAVLAGVPKSEKEGQTALKIAYASSVSIKGNTPYLHHYVSLLFSASLAQ